MPSLGSTPREPRQWTMPQSSPTRMTCPSSAIRASGTWAIWGTTNLHNVRTAVTQLPNSLLYHKQKLPPNPNPTPTPIPTPTPTPTPPLTPYTPTSTQALAPRDTLPMRPTGGMQPRFAAATHDCRGCLERRQALWEGTRACDNHGTLRSCQQRC